MQKLLFFFLLLSHFSCLDLTLTTQFLRDSPVILNGVLQKQYNDYIFNDVLCCMNGELKIIEYNSSQIMLFNLKNYNSQFNKSISVTPNSSPFPLIISQQIDAFTVSMECSFSPTDDNFFNHVVISLQNQTNVYVFSFLLSCDGKNRHKKFQIGYVFLVMINAAITLGVGLRSRIYSLRWRGKAVRVQLTWKRYLLLTILVLVLGLIIFFLAQQNLKTAFVLLRYVGCIFALPFVFVTLNELAYRLLPSQIPLILIIRKCDLVSLVLSVLLVISSLLFENWILFNVLAVCICIGSIKLLSFRSLRQAYGSMGISAGSVLVVAVVMHFILPRSYNDYASELSSPLFLQLPDMIDNLYKKCSWLPVLDIVVPGVCLSLLRDYDINYGTIRIGVYTLVGNISFVAASMLWILIEKLYPFSVPFCTVTYPILMVVVLLTALKRNQHFNLWFGWFNAPEDEDNRDYTKERASTSHVIGDNLLMGALISGEYPLQEKQNTQ